MANKTRRWELLYLFINSSFTALLWIIPIILSIVSTGAYFSDQTDLSTLITIIIGAFLLTGLLQLLITKRIELLKIAINETIEILKQDHNSKVDDVSKRDARSYPDGGKVALGEYNKLIQAIHKNGYYDFECDAFNQLDSLKPVLLFMDTPGMSKIYLTGTQSTSPSMKVLFRIRNPNDMDLRDFARTWFEHIFRILGNACRGISELQSGVPSSNDEVSGDFYVVSKYKFFKKNKKYIFRVYID